MKTGKTSIFLIGFLWLGATLQLGCGKDATSGTTTALGKDGKLASVDRPLRCDTKGRRAVEVDLNQDGKPDVRKVYGKGPEGEVLVCREADLNYDGINDVVYFYDDIGRVVRDEVDLDKDGKIDIISTYIDGKIVKQELDTNSDGVIDSVRYLENDLPIRFEADTDGDRRIDHWEYYEDGKLVRIGMDKSGDGKADEWYRDDAAAAAARDNVAQQESSDEGKSEQPDEDSETTSEEKAE
jgi:hypothetical protein